MKKIAIVMSVFVVVGLCLTTDAPAGKRAVKFSSVYTNLKTECRIAVTKQEEKEMEARGSDIPLVCKGYGGYDIFLASHGAMTQISVRKKKGREEEEYVVSETMHISDDIYMRKVEWRLADGVPFAVIFRRDVFDQNYDPGASKKIGEVLRVMGLTNKKIDFEVDVRKTPNSNEEARRLADTAYASGR